MKIRTFNFASQVYKIIVLFFLSLPLFLILRMFYSNSTQVFLNVLIHIILKIIQLYCSFFQSITSDLF